MRPVCVARSALAPGVPHADLYLTRRHALFIDGVLVPVGCLINGTTITLFDAEEFDELEFFHIKLAHHGVIYAEGAPCETLLQAPDTAAGFVHGVRGHGTTASDERRCAPIVCNGARKEMKSRARSLVSRWLGPQEIDLIRARLEERATTLLAG
jgi:hypothetical protein